MKRSSKAPPPPPRAQTLRWARGCLGVAAALAAYLVWVSTQQTGALGCGPGSDCDRVLGSRWSSWIGVPVSAFGLATYLALLIGAGTWVQQLHGERRLAVWSRWAALCLLNLGAAAWFTAVQYFLVGAFCPFCMTAHVAASVGSVLQLRHGYRVLASQWPRKAPTPVPPFVSAIAKSALVSSVLLGLLVAGQVFISKPTHVVASIVPATNAPPPPTAAPATTAVATGPATSARVQDKPTATAPAATAHRPSAGRKFALHNGEFQLDLNEVPLLGPAQAPHVFVSLFDYTCHHCRDMHAHLRHVRQTFAQELAIVAMPVPLDTNCNVVVKRNVAAHAQACDYARLGLAVWRARPSAFDHFDDWLFKPSAPVPLPQARAYAAQLVGQAALDQALADPWIARQIQTDVALYQANKRVANRADLPQLMLGGTITFGVFEQLEGLYQEIADRTGLNPGPIRFSPQ
jgi:uncharacterized membrane protein/protein-disulfide isomerase